MCDVDCLQFASHLTKHTLKKLTFDKQIISYVCVRDRIVNLSLTTTRVLFNVTEQTNFGPSLKKMPPET